MLDVLMAVLPISVSGILGMWFEVSYINQFFELRHSTLPYWLFFMSKNVVLAVLRYEVSYTGAAWAATANAAFSGFVGLPTLALTFYTWKGDFAQVFLLMFACDIIVNSLQSVVFACITAVAEVGMGPTDESAATSALLLLATTPPFWLLYYVTRRPVTWLLVSFKRTIERHQSVWMVVMVVLAIGVTSANALAPVGAGGVYTRFMVLDPAPTMLFTALVLLALLMRTRSASKRKQTLVALNAIAREYDVEVRSRLQEMERDFATLEGHELVLEEVGLGAGDAETIVAVRDLERAFRGMTVGSYCNKPALDAVLSAGAERLHDLGVKTTFTVAGIPAQAHVPVNLVYSLLTVVCEAAGRSRVCAGQCVDLRVREVTGRPVLCLEAPRSWGSLGARRRLTLMSDEDVALVRERKSGERTEVLVMCPEVSA